jgi:hypothetical protein
VAKIEELVRQISDPKLRDEIATEIKELKKQKRSIVDRFDERRRNGRSNIGSCSKQDVIRFMSSGIYPRRFWKSKKAKYTSNICFAMAAANFKQN